MHLFVMEKKQYTNEELINIEKALDKEGIWNEGASNYCGDLPVKIVEVIISGDWKHDHLYADEIMSGLGFHLLSTETLESDDSDSYKAVRRYSDDEMTIAISRMFAA